MTDTVSVHYTTRHRKIKRVCPFHGWFFRLTQGPAYGNCLQEILHKNRYVGA